jgi:dihydrofolate reductase
VSTRKCCRTRRGRTRIARDLEAEVKRLGDERGREILVIDSASVVQARRNR